MYKSLLILLISVLLITNAQAQLFTLNFTGTSSTCPTPNNYGLQLQNATVSSLNRNVVTCTATADYFNTQGWSSGTAADYNQYIEFTITANTGYQLNLSYLTFVALRSATNSPSSTMVSHDAGSGISTFGAGNTNSYTFPVSTSSAGLVTWDFTDFSTSPGGTVRFRIYGWNAGGPNGTLRLNNIAVYGTIIQNSPVSYDYTNGFMGIGLPSNTPPAERLQVNGKVMIGSFDATSATSMNTNNYILAVNGTAIVNKLIVKKTAQAWPDYVFNDNYKPISLDSLQSYLKQNRHLPDMPSADVVRNEGVDVSTTQAALLRKIEELTLYLLDQNRKIGVQQSEIEALKRQLTGKRTQQHLTDKKR